uniref:NADH-ubiquinone oxidoreductase chain 5 n=1 Tax=Sitona obsoletus TaxID=1541163 RepID=A0A411LWU1_9CUCU|nr:NADH dehydrogenase subunit 5 [Sitona obsoletus]QBF03827.1 NADH dehydrogenase subunit 5 [Sitona obsoletus]
MLSICKIYFMLFLYLSINLFIMALYFILLNMEVFIEYNLLSFNSLSMVMIVFIDWMTLFFMSFVLFIAALVTKYSEDYMGLDKSLNRFILLVVLFVLSMMFLIMSPNLISILLGWDGLGLVSYILVIYYQNIKSYNAGMLTALSNRVGDAALLIAIALMMNFESWNFIFYLDFFKNDDMMKIIMFFVILAAMTKSAQIPFSSWLPAAMAAPTPVSSLVHSSTLVTAGVYLLIRFSSAFSPMFMDFLLFISLFTMFMAGLGANFEFDLKKIIALSTLSQLGLMISILSLGNSDLAFFHLLTHALFKALLFMCAGMIIHSLNNCQDIRFMGGLSLYMPITCTLFNICNLSLCGLPFLSGFYSKDLVVEIMSMGYLNLFVYLIFYLSVGLTVCYSFRVVYYTFTGDSNILVLSTLNENSKIMLSSMIGLVFLVVFMGSILSWVMFPFPYFICLSFVMKMMTCFFILMGIFLGYECAKFSLEYSIKAVLFYNFSMFSASMWNMPFLSTFGVNYYPLFLGKIYMKNFDQGWLEYYGGKNLYNSLKMSSSSFQLFSRNHIKIYLLFIILWLMFMVSFLII